MLLVGPPSQPAFCGNLDTLAPYWVFFKDKGFANSVELELALEDAEVHLTPKARARRSKVMKGRLTEFCDLEVEYEYLNAIRSQFNRHERHISRWLNAVSILLSESEAAQARTLPFVSEVRPVRRFIRNIRDFPQLIAPREDHPLPPPRDYTLEYGGSLRQNLFLNVPELHDRGLRGAGVLVGLLDAGFNNLDHNCFQNLNLVDAWDFVNDDDNVADEEDDMGRGEHGTKVLSIIAGYDPGRMIGMAFEASYLLAKTENTEWEREVEEDHWVAGIEWMDGYGVEVVSSSLSYIDWYEYEDMDGNTGVTSIAADIAARLGIVVVVSMGNSGLNRYPFNKLGAPADADSAFAIGATNADSTLALFSSHGPTYDGRVKPDFTTIGSNVRFASDVHDDGYGSGLGTSFSAPAVAGLCALLIQANPYLTPIGLRELLREVSNNRDDPDSLLGWGIPDGLAALEAGGLGWSQLVIPLHRGWNTISHNLQIEPLDIWEAFAPLVERDFVDIVKDGQGRFFKPDWNFNDIPQWNADEAYQVKVVQDCELTLEGQLRDFREPIQLRQGWQLVTYLPNTELDVRNAMSSLTRDAVLEMVKDEWGRFYLPEQNFSNLEPLEPGRGYHLKLRRDSELVYPRRPIIE